MSSSLLGSAPRSSMAEKATSFFSSAPAAAASAASSAASAPKSFFSGEDASAMASAMAAPAESSSFGRYLIIFLILGFLGLNLALFLIKPANKDLTHLYDPLWELMPAALMKLVAKAAAPTAKASAPAKPAALATATAKPAAPAKASAPATAKASARQEKRPTAEVTPAETAGGVAGGTPGYCYIGEDQGFRSCIEVGEGDVCMSGDIFPTQAVCINPNLRA